MSVPCLWKKKTRKLKLTRLHMPRRAVPVLISLTNKSLPDEIRQRFEKKNVQLIVFRDKTDRANANTAIVFISDNQNTQFVFYEMYIMKKNSNHFRKNYFEMNKSED